MDWFLTAYWICLTVGIGYAVVSFLLGGLHGQFGDAGGHDADFSHSYGVEGHGHGTSSGMDPGDGGPMLFGPFSPLVIAFFLTCFGAVGIMCTSLGGIFLKLALPASMVSGFILAWLLIMAFNKLLGGLHSSSEIRLASLVGCEAEVTVAVPETGVGEIAFVAMGSRNVGAARSDDQTPIARFTAVRISRVVGSTFFVRPVADEVATHMPQDTHAVG